MVVGCNLVQSLINIEFAENISYNLFFMLLFLLVVSLNLPYALCLLSFRLVTTYNRYLFKILFTYC